LEIFFALQCEGNFFDGGYMSEVTDLVVIEKANAMTVFQSADQIEEILQKVEREVMSFVPDITTAKGRKEIASLAYKVAQTKTYLDGLGKDLVAELKEIPKLIDANRKTVRDRLDELKAKARQPLTDYEEEQARIKAEEEAKAAAERAERERIEAEQRAQREAKEAAERAQREAKEAAERAEREKQAAIEAERRKAQEEAERIRREAEQREQARLAEEKRKADEQARREADVKHRKAVGVEVVKALMANTSLTRDQAIEVLTAVKDGRIPHTGISY
jgi:hypothetical protein